MNSGIITKKNSDFPELKIRNFSEAGIGQTFVLFRHYLAAIEIARDPIVLIKIKNIEKENAIKLCPSIFKNDAIITVNPDEKVILISGVFKWDVIYED